MSIHVEIPEPLADQITRIARAQGEFPESVELGAVESRVDPMGRLSAALAPVRDAFRASGLSEDEAVELVEAEEHAMRKERAAS